MANGNATPETHKPGMGQAMLKWPPVVESWLYLDPAEHGDALLARAARLGRPSGLCSPAPCHPDRDRYYTMARRVHVKQLMKGRQ